MSLTFSLNPALDAAAFAPTYAEHKFVQVANLFPDAQAKALSRLLREQMQWKLVFAQPDGSTVQLSQADIKAMGREKMAATMQDVMALAARNHGYCYSAYQMIEARDAGADPGHPIHELTAFLNSPAFIEFASTIIGETGITNVDAQATLFGPGSFLTRHVDEGANHERWAAYTIGLSQNWQTDWGGLLMFIDRKTTDVTSAWLPRFNTLSLFDGHRVHAVSPVSAFAGDARYSIAGWLKND